VRNFHHEAGMSELQDPILTTRATFGVFLRLEEAIDGSLNAVIGESDTSAQSTARHLRRLHDSAKTLAVYLEETNLKAGLLGEEIAETVKFLVDIDVFIESLPAKMEHDLASVRAVVGEIKTLSDMASDVKAISLQSHLLAINAAIEGSRAGPAGSAFKPIADEMRKLAGNSGAVAVRINKGLSRAQEIVENGLQSTIADSSRQLAEVSRAAASIRKLRDNFEDMRQYYKTRFAIVGKHNEDLVQDSAAALGDIENQGLVRQCIERIQVATGRRNEALRALLRAPGEDAAAALPVQLELILDEYLAQPPDHGSRRPPRTPQRPLKAKALKPPHLVSPVAPARLRQER
jgi:methyl-accepting chemotaxis protein